MKKIQKLFYFKWNKVFCIVLASLIIFSILLQLQNLNKCFEKFNLTHKKCVNLNENKEESSHANNNDENGVLVELESLLENIEHTEDYVRYFVSKFSLNDPIDALISFNLNFIQRSR